MSEITDFAGLTALIPGDPLNAEFLRTNILTIDRLLRVGAVTHRHDGHAALADPPQDEDTGPALLIDPVGGTIPADLGIYVGYTWLDADGGETILSDASLVSTEPGLVAPTTAPVLELDHAAGGLLANTYTYGVTVSDGLGGETPLGATAQITVPPGFATSQVEISGLTDILTETGGAEWRLYRARGAGNFTYLTSGSGDTVTDDNTLCPQCDQTPPIIGTTANTNKLIVTLPEADWPTGVASLRLYASIDGSFTGPSLLGTYLPADAGTDQEFTALALQDEQPPTVNLSLPGASLIDPDTELVDWHWKRAVATAADLPVGAEEGDVRLTLDDGLPHRYIDGAWGEWSLGGGGGSSADDPLVGRFDATGVPGAVDDTAPLVMTIPVTAGRVEAVRLSLYLTHPNCEEVKITVEAPDGTTAKVYDHAIDGIDLGTGNTSDATRFILDDLADEWISDVVADGPVGSYHSYNPQYGAGAGLAGPLSVFRHHPAEGDWTVTFEVQSGGDPGSVEGLTLIFDPAPVNVRGDVSKTATALAAAAQANLDVPLGLGYALYRVTTNRAARVRLYATVAQRAADTARAFATPPTGNHGVILDIETSAGQLFYALVPAPTGFSLEALPVPVVPVRITNLDVSTGDTTVTFTRVMVE